ncbi:hypothetical protein KXD93_19440 [Mucilaginibacter sp. BJC16-A38]|uniref:hypothetical protein n=1 Tax=Mucilaginibacter phenanthrenivorans TaxID=1234842 RepID=UPI0021572F35|nr:hypothetical protein [Mucilaginibacter phenanthrenivorans]MCR8559833.1 hypothetical protein [Mucilaginibacter phenanthrenivorans]
MQPIKKPAALKLNYLPHIMLGLVLSLCALNSFSQTFPPIPPPPPLMSDPDNTTTTPVNQHIRLGDSLHKVMMKGQHEFFEKIEMFMIKKIHNVIGQDNTFLGIITIRFTVGADRHINKVILIKGTGTKYDQITVDALKAQTGEFKYLTPLTYDLTVEYTPDLAHSIHGIKMSDFRSVREK